MAEADLERFLTKVRSLNAFVAASETDPALRQKLAACNHHDEVVSLAASLGFAIGRRWGEADPASSPDGEGGNLLGNPGDLQAGEERITVLLQTDHWRLERIHSCQSSSPEGFWYDQPEHEWVCLLQGSARLRFQDEAKTRELRAGDQLSITAHRLHRVEGTDGGKGTVWLALFWRER